MTVALNGWTAARLDDLARKVDDGFAELRSEIADMRNDELADLKKDLAEAKQAPRDKLTAYLIPLVVAVIPTTAILITHG